MFTNKGFLFAAGTALAAGSIPAGAQDTGTTARPHIFAVSQVALYVHDIGVSRRFYHDFLGFDESYTLTRPDGSLRAALIKINDRQSIELIPENAPNTDRLNHIALETDNAEGMRLYLKSRGFKVPDHLTLSEINSANFWVNDPDGAPWEVYTVLADAPAGSGIAGDGSFCVPAIDEAVPVGVGRGAAGAGSSCC